MLRTRKTRRFLLGILASWVCLAALSHLPARAADIGQVKDLAARDWPYDAGDAILITWRAMPFESKDVEYAVMAAQSAGGPWKEAARFPSNTKLKSDVELPFWAWRKTDAVHAVKFNPLKAFPPAEQKGDDKKKLKKARKKAEEAARRAEYHFKVVTLKGETREESGVVSAKARGNLFNLPRLNNFFFTFVFCGIVLWFISYAKKKDLFLRRIPGLDAVEEAIGRATEMGRPIYYLTGRKDIDEIPTIAAALILGEIAKKVAQYDTILKVPHTYALTMSMCQEITKQAYSTAGRPDAYREDMNFFITDDQFAYTAAVNGMMAREKPAACFYMGYYYAESLLLAEVGTSVGAIQIAGTDAEHQLPFFFITCDYTLIGEELYAAGGYLSRDPVLVGTLRGQDVGKAFTMIVVFLGVFLSTMSVLFGFEGAADIILQPFKSF